MRCVARVMCANDRMNKIYFAHFAVEITIYVKLFDRIKCSWITFKMLTRQIVRKLENHMKIAQNIFRESMAWSMVIKC